MNHYIATMRTSSGVPNFEHEFDQPSHGMAIDYITSVARAMYPVRWLHGFTIFLIDPAGVGQVWIGAVDVKEGGWSVTVRTPEEVAS